jgi:hypothetical protein
MLASFISGCFCKEILSDNYFKYSNDLSRNKILIRPNSINGDKKMEGYITYKAKILPILLDIFENRMIFMGQCVENVFEETYETVTNACYDGKQPSKYLLPILTTVVTFARWDTKIQKKVQNSTVVGSFGN